MNQIATMFKLEEIPVRTFTRDLPAAFIKQFCHNEDSLIIKGQLTMDYIKQVLNEFVNTRNAEITKTLMEEGSMGCVDKGLVNPMQIQALEHGKNVIDKKKEEQAFLMKDVALGKTIELPFRGKRIILKVLGQREGDPSHEKLALEETENGFRFVTKEKCQDDESKQRHLYIYSKSPNYGKTTVADAMTKEFNAVIVNDPNNFDNIRSSSQFIIFDEYGKERSLKFDHLKQLTSGHAKVFAGNRKSCGPSFVPRDDVQVIMFSNQHLFEVYANIWDNKEKRHKITKQRADILKSRFQIYKLDDHLTSEEEDALQLIDVGSDQDGKDDTPSRESRDSQV